VRTEADPLDPKPPAALRTAQAAILHLEQAVTTIEWGDGLALRYGMRKWRPGGLAAKCGYRISRDAQAR
jgi:hypothetical protein